MTDWKYIRLNEVCDLIAGYAFKSSDFGDYPIKVIRIGDIKPSFVDVDNAIGVNIQNYELNKLSKFEIVRGDFILAMTGATIGKIGFYLSPEKNYINQRVLLFRPKGNINRKFLYYTLNDKCFNSYIINHIDSESAQPNISAGTIGKYTLSVPSLDEQKNIAGILSSLDEKIETNRKINALLEELAQTIFKSWFIDFEPFSGKMPKDWTECNLEDLLTVRYGKDHKNLADGIFPVYGSGGIMRYTEKYLYDKESVLIPRKGSLNNIYYIDDPFWSVDTMFFTEMKKDNLAKYIYFCLKGLDFESMNCGSAIPSMSTSILNALKVILPSDSVLAKFEETINPLFIKVKDLQKESVRLAALRDTLLPKLMSGEVKLT